MFGSFSSVPRRLSAAARSSFGSRALVYLGCGLAGLVAAHYVAGIGGGHIPKPLALVMGLAGAVIMLSLGAEQLMLPWLFLAPLLQDSAQKTRLGHLLALALFTAPPLAFGLKVALSRRRWPARVWYDTLPVLFAAYVLISLIVTNPGALRSGAVGTLRGLFQTVGLGVLLYYLVAYWPGRIPSLLRICQTVLAAVAVQSVMTTIEWGSGWNLWHDTTWQQPTDFRSIGTLSNPALTGAFIGAGIVVALAILCWNGPVQLRRLAILTILVGLPGLAATKTRGPILATLITAAVCVLLSSRFRLVGAGVLAVIAMAILFFLPQIKSSSVYQNRIDQKQNVEIRLVLQTISFRLAEKKPVLGWGYDSFDRIKFDVPVTSSSVPLATALKFTSHDTYLTMLVEYGVVGLALFVAPWVFVLARGVRAARVVSPDRWFFVAGIAAVAVIGLTATTIDYRFFSFVPALAWLFLGLIRRRSEELGRAAA